MLKGLNDRMGFFWEKLKLWKCSIVPDICRCSWSCSMSNYFQNNNLQGRYFLMGKESHDLQGILKRSLYVNTVIPLCCLWPSRSFFLESYEIYYSAIFIKAFLCCLYKNECRFLKLVRFGAFVFLCLWCCFLGWLVEWDFVTDKLVSFYHQKYCQGKESSVIVL